MQNCKHVSTPVAVEMKFTKDMAPQTFDEDFFIYTIPYAIMLVQLAVFNI